MFIIHIHDLSANGSRVIVKKQILRAGSEYPPEQKKHNVSIENCVQICETKNFSYFIKIQINITGVQKLFAHGSKLAIIESKSN